MWGMVISIVVAIVIGIIGDSLARGNMPGGLAGAFIAGFAGAWTGSTLMDGFGPKVAGYALVPAMISAALFVFLIGLLGRALRAS